MFPPKSVYTSVPHPCRRLERCIISEGVGWGVTWLEWLRELGRWVQGYSSCPSVCPSVRPSVQIRPSVHPSGPVWIRPHPFNPSVRPSVRPPVCPWVPSRQFAFSSDGVRREQSDVLLLDFGMGFLIWLNLCAGCVGFKWLHQMPPSSFWDPKLLQGDFLK